MKKKITVLLLALVMLASCVPAFAEGEENGLAALTKEDILSVPLRDDGRLIDNLDLDLYKEIGGESVTWTSSDPSVISENGVVSRGEEDKDVTLTASVGENETKSFNFNVPAAQNNVYALPNMTESYVDETFSGTELPANVTTLPCDPEKDTYEVKNGKAVLTRSDWSYLKKEPGFEISKDASKTAISGKFVIDFTVNTTSRYLRYAFIEKNWSGYATFCVWDRSAGTFSVDYTDENASKSTSHNIGNFQDNKMKCTFFFDTTAKRFSLWINNELILTNVKFRSNVGNIGMFRIFTLTDSSMNGTGSVALDNVKIYKAEESTLFTDALALSESSILAAPKIREENGTEFLCDDLNLLTKAASGADIEWSSEPALIDSEGRITRQLTDTEVTLCGSVSDSNGNKLEKTFAFNIPGKYHDVAGIGYPREGEMLYSDSFSDGVIAQNISYDSSKGSVEEKSGTLSLTSPGWSEIPYIRIYNNTKASASDLNGKFCEEFVVKSTSDRFRMRWINSNWEEVTYMEITNFANLVLNYKDESGARTLQSTVEANGTYKVKVLFDFSVTPARMTVWLNDTKILDDEYTKAQRGVAWTQFYTAGSGSYGGKGVVTIDNYKVYRVDESETPGFYVGDFEYTNAGTVVKGENGVSIPLFVTNADNEREASLILAVYSSEGKRLEKIAVTKAALSPLSQQKISASVNIEDVPENATMKAFLFEDLNNIKPIK